MIIRRCCQPILALDVAQLHRHALVIDSYQRFPFLPTVEPSKRGNVYEIRTYRLKTGGLVPTMQGWKQAMGPAPRHAAEITLIGSRTGP